MLKAYRIETLVDIRHYPGSRYCPQFGKARLKRNLERNSIKYVHMENLGGRRNPDKDSDLNEGWRSPQFRGYADYMQTNEFKLAVEELIEIALKSTSAIMCSEAVPWRCHRSLVSDALMTYGFKVMDIFSKTNLKLHKHIPFAKIKGKKVIYPKVEEARP